jgi:hypothetical protein
MSLDVARTVSWTVNRTFSGRGFAGRGVRTSTIQNVHFSADLFWHP